MSARFLFACWPFEGHVFPTMSVATALRERGAEVAFYTRQRLRPIVEAQGIECSPSTGSQACGSACTNGSARSAGGAASLRLQREAFRLAGGGDPDQVADLRAVDGRWHPDVIVTDGSMWGPSLVLHEADGIPVVVRVDAHLPAVPGRDAPLPGSGLGPPRGAAGRGRRVGGSRVRWTSPPAAPAAVVDGIRAGHGLRPLGCSVNECDGRPAALPRGQRRGARLQPARPPAQRALRRRAAVASARAAGHDRVAGPGAGGSPVGARHRGHLALPGAVRPARRGRGGLAGRRSRRS